MASRDRARRWRAHPLAALLWGACAATAAAQPGTAGPLTLAEQLELARLVDIAAQRLKLNIEYDPALLKGNVTLRLGAGVTDEQLWDLTNRLLAARGFTTVSPPGRDGVLSVVKLESAAALARVQQEGVSSPDALEPGFGSVVYRLQHRSAKQVEEAIKSVLSKPGGSVTVLGENLILITDLAPRIDQTLALLRSIDAPGEAAQLMVVPVHNLTAVQLTALATQVIAKRELVGTREPAIARGDILAAADDRHVLIVAPPSAHGFWRDLISTLDQREPTETRTYAPHYFELKEVQRLLQETTAGDDQLRIVVDELTGTLVVTATQTRHHQVAAFIDRLNATPAEGRRPLRFFKIRNRGVNDILAVLQSLVSAGQLEGDWTEVPPSGAAVSAPAPASTSAPSATGTPDAGAAPPVRAPTAEAPSASPNPGRDDAGVTLARNRARRGGSDGRGMATSADRVGGSGGSGGSRRGGGSGGVGADLVLTADEGTSSIIAIGPPRLLAQLELLIKQLDVRQPQVMVQALVVSLSDSQARDLGVELEGQINLSGDSLLRLSSLFGLSTAGPQVGVRNSGGAGGTGLLLSPGEFAVVIRALEAINNGRAVSIPQVLVNNNQQASFNSTLEQPYATILNGSGENPQTTFGGSSSAGTVVTAKPQIGQGDHLLLDYTVELSAFVGEAAADLPPPKQTNNVASSVTLPDGYTVAVGGLEFTSDSKSVDQIPLLSQIPILGEAFKNRSSTNSRSRFFVFLRADVMRHERFEDLKYTSELRAMDAGIDDGWPVLEPRVIR